MLQYNDPIDAAVKAVWETKARNKDWPLSFVVGKIAEWHNVAYSAIMSRINSKSKKGGRNTRPKPKDPYGGKVPYWARD